MAFISGDIASKTRRNPTWMKHTITAATELEKLLLPETSLEKKLLETPEFQEGMLWGEPRFGHPEGKVALHVREILDNINQLSVSGDARQKLRLIAFSHDTFKFMQPKGLPRNRDQHHGVLARQFMEEYCEDKVVLDITELHDEAFYIWRNLFVRHQQNLAHEQLNHLMWRMEENLTLYFHFFRVDTMTGDKLQSPLTWFQGLVKEKGVNLGF